MAKTTTQTDFRGEPKLEQGTPLDQAVGWLVLHGWTVDVKPNPGGGHAHRGWSASYVPFLSWDRETGTLTAYANGDRVIFEARRELDQ